MPSLVEVYEYLLAQLPVSTYKLTADAQGFKQAELPAVTVHPQEHLFEDEQYMPRL